MASYLFGKINVNDELLARDLETHKSFPRIAEEYDEFSTGFWQNCSVYNASGDGNDTMYRDYDHQVRLTEMGRQLPYIEQLLRENFVFENLKMVRTRNLIDAMVIPHKDFVELNKPMEQYFRIFIPLEDNELAFHSDEENVFRMRKGEVWFLDAAIVHAAVNFSNRNRLFLCLDYAFPGDFHPSDIFVNKNMYTTELTPCVVEREQAEPGFEEQLIASLSPVMNRQNFKDIVILLSKVHFYKNVPIEACYDWLVEIAENTGDRALVQKAQDLRNYLIRNRALGERFSINDWKTLEKVAK